MTVNIGRDRDKNHLTTNDFVLLLYKTFEAESPSSFENDGRSAFTRFFQIVRSSSQLHTCFIYKVNIRRYTFIHTFIYLYSALLYGGKGDTMKIPYDTLPSSKMILLVLTDTLYRDISSTSPLETSLLFSLYTLAIN